mgnify:CR=1 FL=1
MSGIVKETGLYYYGEKLLKYLKKMSPEIIYIPFNYGIIERRRNLLEKAKSNLWEQVFLPFEILTNKISILHGIKNSGLPFIRMCKYVLTLCDVIPLLYPNQYLKSQTERSIYINRLRASVSVADKIIFLNSHVLKDVTKFVHIPDEKISVIPLGIDEEDNQKINDKQNFYVRNKYKIGNSPFIFAVGADEPRKNNLTLIKTFFKLKSEKKIRNFKLVIAGRKWNNPEFDRYVNTLEENIKRDIIFTGHVDRYELQILYKQADIFVFLSLSEGFGLPPLEAMLFGTPVITSNIPVISDVVGDAGIKVNPLEIKEVSNAIERLIVDKQLRYTLIERGYKRVKIFNFEKTAKLTLQLYKQLLCEGNVSR